MAHVPALLRGRRDILGPHGRAAFPPTGASFCRELLGASRDEARAVAVHGARAAGRVFPLVDPGLHPAHAVAVSAEIHPAESVAVRPRAEAQVGYPVGGSRHEVDKLIEVEVASIADLLEFAADSLAHSIHLLR